MKQKDKLSKESSEIVGKRGIKNRRIKKYTEHETIIIDLLSSYRLGVETGEFFMMEPDLIKEAIIREVMKLW